MRLLFAGVSWPLETFLARLLRKLCDAGIQVTIACSGRPGKEWLERSEIEWLPLPQARDLGVWRAVRPALLLGLGLARAPEDVLLFARQMAQPGRITDRLNAWFRLLPFAGRRWDVIYFPWNTAAITYLPLFDLGCPVVVSCRGAHVNVAPHNPERADIRQGLRITFERAAAVHCVSHAILQEAQQYGLDPAKARVITPAVDVEWFCPDGEQMEEGGRRTEDGGSSADYADSRGLLADDPTTQRPNDPTTFNLITTGSLIWRKGYEYLLVGIRRLVDAGVPARLRIIGDGPERARIVYTVGDLGLQSHVEMCGRLAPSAVRDLLQQSDAFVLTSLSEGISNAVLEAMACGLPVVTTDCGGMREAVEDGKEGFVVPVRDPEALVIAMEKLWSDPELRSRMGVAGRTTAVERFDLDQQAKAFLELFRDVAARRTAGRVG